MITSSSSHVISQNLDDERYILLDVKRRLGNPPSLKSWKSSSSPCDWPEITCTNDNNAVIAVSLVGKSITHKIPATVCDLKNLTVLDVSYNFIPGQFPDILNCSKLEYLLLMQNAFVGPIPADIDRLSRLQYLDLTGNNFSGDIPASIGRLRELVYLFLVQNEFNGTWPTEIGSLANLEQLVMAYNDKFLPAPLPEEFGALKMLKFLWMTETNLIGRIPETLINNLSSLEHLDLAINNLNGPIPGGLLMSKNLINLYLFNNRLSGHIPSSIGALNLKDIDLSKNILTGPIPEGFGKLQNLTALSLFWNQLSGEIPADISFVPTLETFKVFSNQLSGVLPPEFGLHSELRRFEVSENKLSGELPRHLCAKGALIGVVASNNHLSGEVPKSLGSCRSLITIQLTNNRFSGEIPSGIWTSPGMVWVMLGGNSFSGTLPGKLGSNLSRIEISDNKFSGPIPAGLSSSWLKLLVFEASNNLISGEIPVELTSLPSIFILSLDGNQLSGQLPHHIVSWKSLIALNLSGNHLSGTIPKAIGSLPSLKFLDLSENQFSGEIPHEFSHFVPNTFNLSSNNLFGEIPPAFEKWEFELSFLNNPNLCAYIPILKSCRHSKASDSSKLSTNYLVMIISFSLTASLIIVFLIFFMAQKYHQRRRDQAGNYVETWRMTSFQKLDFTESNILSSLTQSSSSLIGSGGSRKVYRVVINHSGEVVAVKWISNDRKLGHQNQLEKQFAAEVQILGMIRHSNIVKLLCCISSETSKLLVYEYMENQSLDKWLHAKKRTEEDSVSDHDMVLDWPMRLKIAIGAARGLCYMHHDCSPPIIHRDVKSSNILLDSQFNTKIADFGLAKMLLAKQEGPAETMSV